MERVYNAYGHSITIQPSTYAEVWDFISKINNAVIKIREVQGVMLIGSTIEHNIDPCTDIDLRICHKPNINVDQLKQRVYQEYLALGLAKDNLKSIHSPFDDFSFQFDNMYLETEFCTLSDIEGSISTVLNGKISDDGIIHAFQTGKILHDDNDKLLNLQQSIKSLEVSPLLVEFCIKRYEAVSLKLMLHSIMRKDYANAYYWTWRTFIDSSRILFAKNKTFFPGTKRLLTHYIPKLTKCPDTFIEFWGAVFGCGNIGWEKKFMKKHLV